MNGLLATYAGYGMSVWHTAEEAAASMRAPRVYDGIARHGTNPATHTPMQTNTVALGLSLEERFEIRQRLVAIAAETKAQLDAENDAIKADMVRQGIDAYPVGDGQELVLSAREGRATLDKGELVALGVSVETIKAATKKGSDYLQLDVRKVKA